MLSLWNKRKNRRKDRRWTKRQRLNTDYPQPDWGDISMASFSNGLNESQAVYEEEAEAFTRFADVLREIIETTTPSPGFFESNGSFLIEEYNSILEQDKKIENSIVKWSDSLSTISAGSASTEPINNVSLEPSLMDMSWTPLQGVSDSVLGDLEAWGGFSPNPDPSMIDYGNDPPGEIGYNNSWNASSMDIQPWINAIHPNEWGYGHNSANPQGVDFSNNLVLLAAQIYKLYEELTNMAGVSTAGIAGNVAGGWFEYFGNPKEQYYNVANAFANIDLDEFSDGEKSFIISFLITAALGGIASNPLAQKAAFNAAPWAAKGIWNVATGNGPIQRRKKAAAAAAAAAAGMGGKPSSGGCGCGGKCGGSKPPRPPKLTGMAKCQAKELVNAQCKQCSDIKKAYKRAASGKAYSYARKPYKYGSGGGTSYYTTNPTRGRTGSGRQAKKAIGKANGLKARKMMRQSARQGRRTNRQTARQTRRTNRSN